jgi:serine protease inhibitor
MPKFELESGFQLKGVLSRMGMPTALFLIRDIGTGAILFMGCVVHPGE